MYEHLLSSSTMAMTAVEGKMVGYPSSVLKSSTVRVSSYSTLLSSTIGTVAHWRVRPETSKDISFKFSPFTRRARENVFDVVPACTTTQSN